MNIKKILILFFLLSKNILYSQWIIQPTGVSSYLRDIDFINSQTGWVCGDGGTILKTTNGGKNWISQVTGVTDKPLFSIHPVDSNVVYCVGWFETILKTTNGGNNWTIIENAPFGEGSSYESCFFIDENTGWIGSTHNFLAKVRKTTDGGKSFENIILNSILRDIYFINELNGIGVGEVAFISKTSNGGENWSSYSIAGTGNLYRLSILNDGMTGFVVSSRDILYKTTDFGISWDSVGFIPNVISQLYSSSFSSDSLGWAGSISGVGIAQLFKTTNGGRNWTYQNQSNTRSYNDIFALNDSLVWTCGGFGTIFHTNTGGDTIVNISQISATVPENFQLNQNYPNPFNSETKISFRINKKDIYKLEIYDNLGRLIQKSFEEIINPGEYNYILNINDLGTGIYFYTLSSTNNLQTKKMVIIK
ncbi:MAG TPA: hypothetical protein DEP28_01240 [Bacteroidetes bacterium]|nr:hypothetical protein [Bacteroidota bacterium]